jgi:DNA replication protein
MLKYLIQKGYVNVNKLLLENYPSFGLNELELVVLLKLFEMLKNNQVTISVSALAKKTSLSSNECSNVLNGLFNRGLVTIDLENTKQGKTKESFNLDECIKFIEGYFYNEMKSKGIAENEESLGQITNLIEQTFKRGLTPLELQIIVEWGQNGETIQDIQKALAMAVGAGKTNLKYVDSCLVAIKNKATDDVVLDESKTKILNDFYRNIK